MDKKIVMIICLIGLIGVGVFVGASYNSETRRGELMIREGWNLVPFLSGYSDDGLSSPSLSEALYIYGFDNQEQQYDLIYIKGATQEEQPEIYSKYLSYEETNKGLYSSVWAYFEKEGKLSFYWEESLNNNFEFDNPSFGELIKGWNFIFITPSMAGKSLSDIEGDCTYERILAYSPDEGGWLDLLSHANNKEMLGENAAQMEGLVIKVSSDCNLGESGSSTAPPGLPGGSDLTPTEIISLRDDVYDYYYEEFAYEECDLNSAEGYTSKEDCETAWDCLAEEYAELIPEGDLEDLVGEMSEHGGEAGSIYYHEENPSVDEEMRNSKFSLCLAGKYEGY